jgi:flavin reductase (DIM6/NTAB) family NADH-FMN oxidoreductase RutF
MTIGWGTYGVQWGKEIFIAFVRVSRYTRELLDQNPEFTVNIPLGDFDREILKVCGRESGRDIDKVEKLNLTLEDSKEISVPGIKELPLTLECKVVYRQEQVLDLIDPRFVKIYYPKSEGSEEREPGADEHVAYYGEIVNAYIVE